MKDAGAELDEIGLAGYPATRTITASVLEAWPEHARYLRKSFAGRDAALMATTDRLAEAVGLLAGERLAEVAAHYRWTCDRLREEELHFHRTGRYRLTSFAEAEREVYADRAYMAKYMDGLLFSQVLWVNHAASCHFFLTETPALLAPGARYLEIGPGHGLMIYLALRDFGLASAAAWDISEVSLAQTRAALARLGRTDCDFRVQDIADAHGAHGPHDLVVVSEVLEHLEDPAGALGHLRPLVAPERGLLFVNVPINSPSPDHLHLLESPEAARALVTGAGFEILAEGFFATQGAALERALRNRVSVSACLLARPAG